MARVPLAWCNLTGDRGKFLLAVLAVAIAVTLLFVQLGFYNALMDSAVRLIEALNADLILVHQGREYVSYPEGFPRQVLDKVRPTPGVASVHALTMDVTLTRLLDPDRAEPTRPRTNAAPAPGERLIRVLAVDPEEEILRVPELALRGKASQVAKLRLPGQALFDWESRPEFGLRAAWERNDKQPFETELAGRRIRLAGTFVLGRDFMAEGNLLVSEETFRDYLRAPFPFLAENVDLGLVRLARRDGRPAEPVQVVQDRINQALDADKVPVRAYTLPELMEKEQTFWLNSTPVGQVFYVGLVMGFVVGAIICYQILSSGVADRLPEYATLRAIGYSNRYLGAVVLQEALILAAVGFLPGLGLAWGVYQLLELWTGLPLRFTPWRVFLVFLVSVGMCVAAALLAVREAQRVDPAEVF